MGRPPNEVGSCLRGEFLSAISLEFRKDAQVEVVTEILLSLRCSQRPERP